MTLLDVETSWRTLAFYVVLASLLAHGMWQPFATLEDNVSDPGGCGRSARSCSSLCMGMGGGGMSAKCALVEGIFAENPIRNNKTSSAWHSRSLQRSY